MKILIVLSALLVFNGCMQDHHYIGEYSAKHKYGAESITLYPNHTFLQTFSDSNSRDTNEGVWRIESMRFYEPNRLVLDGWMRFKDPTQSDESINWEHTRSVVSFIVSNGCIVTDPDFHEFNLCR